MLTLRSSLFAAASLVTLTFGSSAGAATTDSVKPSAQVAPDTCITNVQPTQPGQPRRFQCSGDEVSFFVDISPRCAQGGCGLIVNLPGSNTLASSIESLTGLMKRARADQDANPNQAGFIVMGAQRDIPGQRLPSFNTNFRNGSADEIFRFMQRAAKVFSADTNRIHVGGFSQGAFLTFNFLCDPQKAAFISSAAPMAGLPPQGVSCFGPAASGAVNPDVPFVFTSGRNDRIVPFAQQQQVTQTIMSSLQPLRSMQVVAQDAQSGFVRMRFVGNDGRTFDQIVHNGTTSTQQAGHCFVGADMDAQGLACNPPSPFMNGQVTFEFYKSHPRDPMRPAVQLAN